MKLIKGIIDYQFIKRVNFYYKLGFTYLFL